MKLLYVTLARAIWLFDMRLLNPKGLSLHEVFQKIAERYRFAKFPKDPLDFNEQKALAFEQGVFTNSRQESIAVSFAVWNNGVTAETSSTTRDATEFLREFFEWINREYGFWIPSGKGLNKGYLSQIDVECDRPLISVNPRLELLSKMLTNRYSPLDGKPREFVVGGLQFWTEDVGQLLAPAAFRFERKWGFPAGANQFFSQAPLETQDHMELLNELENILSA